MVQQGLTFLHVVGLIIKSTAYYLKRRMVATLVLDSSQ